MIAHLDRRDTPIARALLVLLPLAFASALVALAGTSSTELEADVGASTTAAVADAAPASGAGAGLKGAALESPRIASMLEIHDDRQALLYGRSTPGAEFVVYANNLECARDTADAGGWWVVAVPEAAPCAPAAGSVLWIARDGEFLARAQVWNPGSRSVGDGIKLDAPPGPAQQGLSPPQLSSTN